MNREIEAFIRSLDCPNVDALEISGTGSQGRYDFRSYQTVTFPNYDVCKGPLAEEKFDLVITALSTPSAGLGRGTNVLQMLRARVNVVICTPVCLKVHGAPLDLYKDQQQGMAQLLETAAGLRFIRTA